MSRSIKFRAWDGDGMHYGGFSIHATGKVTNEFPGVVNDVELKIMEFTGFKDKNDIEIFEFDILKGSYKNHSVKIDNSVGLVKMGYIFDADGWAHDKIYGWVCGEESLYDLVSGEHDQKKCKVIGNIYQHPQLLQEK